MYSVTCYTDLDLQMNLTLTSKITLTQLEHQSGHILSEK